MIFGRGAEKVSPLLDSGKQVGSWKARHYGAAKFPGEEINLSVVMETVENAGDATAADQKVLACLKPIRIRGYIRL